MKLANQRGSIIPSILLVSALLGLIGVFMTRFTDEGLNSQKYLREQQAIANTYLNVLNILLDPEACKANFAGRSVNSGAPDTVDQIVASGGPSPTVFVREGDGLEDRVITLTSLRLYDFKPYTTASSDLGTINAELGFNSGNGGGMTRARNVLLSVRATGGNITECVAMGASSEVWQMSPAGDVYYSGRNVGVGTANPIRSTLYAHNLHVQDVGPDAKDVIATDYFHPSDLRLKKDLEPAPGLAAIERLRGVRFVWNEGGPAYGVIAQNVATVIPEAVDTSGEYLRVDYNQLIVPLIASVQELAQRNRELRRRLARLKSP